MHERLAVYVPDPEGDSGLSTATIVRGSAIVGVPGDDPVHIYYEGNINGASNMVTFADRAYFAAGRLRQHAPTIAQRAVPEDALFQVGWYYPDHQRVEIHNGTLRESGGLSVTRLAKWLGLYDEDRHAIDSDRLSAELVETRATPARFQGQRVHVTPQDRARLARKGLRLEDS